MQKRLLHFLKIILLFLISCECGKRDFDVFAESNYIMIEQDSKKGDYEVYINKVDTGRKMLKYYWENGRIYSISFFKNGKKEGRWLEYFDNSNISAELFFKNGLKDSVHKTYYTNGKVASIEKYKNGEEIGIWQYFDTSGRLDHMQRKK